MKSIINCGLVVVLLATVFACTKPCNCTDSFDATITYKKNDLVKYNDTCWIAVAQGRGIVPGPWLQNGNDIWEVCVD